MEFLEKLFKPKKIKKIRKRKKASGTPRIKSAPKIFDQELLQKLEASGYKRNPEPAEIPIKRKEKKGKKKKERKKKIKEEPAQEFIEEERNDRGSIDILYAKPKKITPQTVTFDTITQEKEEEKKK